MFDNKWLAPPPVVYSQHDIILVAMSDVNQAVQVRCDLEL